MHHRETSRIAIEEIERLSTAEHHPVEIHLEVDERRIGAGEKQIERSHTVNIRQLEIVVVVSEAKSGRLCLGAKGVEHAGELAPVVGGFSSLSGSHGTTAHSFPIAFAVAK